MIEVIIQLLERPIHRVVVMMKTPLTVYYISN